MKRNYLKVYIPSYREESRFHNEREQPNQYSDINTINKFTGKHKRFVLAHYLILQSDRSKNIF